MIEDIIEKRLKEKSKSYHVWQRHIYIKKLEKRMYFV